MHHTIVFVFRIIFITILILLVGEMGPSLNDIHNLNTYSCMGNCDPFSKIRHYLQPLTEIILTENGFYAVLFILAVSLFE